MAPSDAKAIGRRMDVLKDLDPLMENVTRLAGDAALLRDNGRYASACVLAVIALEEVGKLAHLLWEAKGIPPVSTRKNWHLRKQSAALALVFSAGITKDIVAMLDSEEEDEAAIAALADRVSRSPAAKRLAAAERGLVDRAKKTGLYHDELGDAAVRGSLTRRDVDELIAQSVDAIAAMTQPQTLLLSRVVYDAIKDRL